MALITHVHDCDVQYLDDPVETNGPFRDCWLHDAEGHVDDAHDFTQFQVGEDDGGKEPEVKHALILFDLNRFLPADAVIVSAVWHINIPETTATTSHTFSLSRVTRTNWEEDKATWNKYDGTNSWTSPGGDFAVPTISLGSLDTPGWKTHTITDLVTDAWDNRSGILSMGIRRTGGTGEGQVQIDAQNRHSSDSSLPHHLRIVYTLDSKTFQALIFDINAVPDASLLYQRRYSLLRM